MRSKGTIENGCSIEKEGRAIGVEQRRGVSRESCVCPLAQTSRRSTWAFQ